MSKEKCKKRSNIELAETKFERFGLKVKEQLSKTISTFEINKNIKGKKKCGETSKIEWAETQIGKKQAVENSRRN